MPSSSRMKKGTRCEFLLEDAVVSLFMSIVDNIL